MCSKQLQANFGWPWMVWYLQVPATETLQLIRVEAETCAVAERLGAERL